MKKLAIAFATASLLLFSSLAVAGCYPVEKGHAGTMAAAPLGTTWYDFDGQMIKDVIYWSRINNLLPKDAVVNAVRLYEKVGYPKVALGFSNNGCTVWFAVFPTKVWHHSLLGGNKI